MSRNLDHLSQNILTGQKEASVSVSPDTSLNLQSFLRSEREKAILSIVEHVKKSTIEKTEQMFNENLEKDWEQEKLRILNSTFAEAADVTILTGAQPTDPRPDSQEITEKVIGLIRENKPFSQIMGYMSEDGCRVPGTIDRSRSQRQVDTLITAVANSCENQGFLEEAVQLYDLCGNHSKALEILNSLLSTAIPEARSEGSPRDRLEALALKLAERLAPWISRNDINLDFQKVFKPRSFFQSANYSHLLPPIGSHDVLQLLSPSKLSRCPRCKY